MKPVTTALLVVSVALNAALAYAALTGRARLAESENPNSALSTLNSQLSASSTPGSASVDPATWSKLETTDLPDLVTRLRAAGFPKEMIRAIMSGLINEQFTARRRALDPDAANRAYWKDRAPDQKLQLAQFQLYREQEKALRSLLGPDARNTDPLSLARQRAMLGNLSPEKMEAAQLIIDELNQKQTEAYYTKGNSTITDYNQRERDLRTALSAVLSPAELEEYDLRNSNTGRTLRRELASFDPTEEEFRAIYKLRQPFDEKYTFNTSGVPSQDAMRQRSEAQKQLVADVKTLLGADRAAAYERSTDYNYQRTAQLIARLELPPETTVTLWNTQKEFEQRRSDLFRNAATLTPEERTQQLTTLQQEAIAKITPLLGGQASRVEAYKQYGGTWISNLVPRPRPPPQ